MKLSKWAKQTGVSYQTAWNIFKAGKLENAYKLPTGTIIVPDVKTKTKSPFTVTYARVSSTLNKKYLESQTERIVAFCNVNGWSVNQSIEEVGSGLNDSRPKLLSILEQSKVTRLVVEHKDRLTRFGFNFIKLLCQKNDCELIVINETLTEQDDLIQDFISVITSFCARIYGQRRGKRKTHLIKEVLNEKDL